MTVAYGHIYNPAINRALNLTAVSANTDYFLYLFWKEALWRIPFNERQEKASR
jgi:hypothetical protein